MDPRKAGRLTPRDLVQLAALTLVWGVNWPVMKLGVREFAPLSFRVISMGLGLVVLAAIVRARRERLRVARAHWPELAWIGLTNMTVWFVLSIYAIKLLASGRAAILGYTLPIWAAVWSIVLYRERPPARLAAGLVAAAIGVALLLSSELSTLSGQPLGTVLMLAAAAVWGLGTHLMRRRRVDASPLVITFWSLAQGFVVCAVIALAFERHLWLRAPNAIEWGAIAYNAFLVFGFAQLIWFRLVSLLPPVASGLSVMAIPVVGLFSGMLMLGERPHWQDWFALLAVLVAIGAVLLPARGVRQSAP